MSRLFLAVMIAVSLLSPLSACGKKGDPKAPDGSVYPRNYPAPQ